ncbi:uncharacterized protein LOC132726029 [Ruditapes philippinarum]|uniref:uncharacterized protein LOC132726029 n=1 Tax=Ruditapes philippinarum TaxID=129788 RepID=UPI00295BCEAF|nr:uncharacterized protein LOC132726029 [Ruditapes philippinarum]XP_060567258.1 uncharacterized protein LOC132726029 [Ruditapes philippinarum]XP_060567259.1 uncharacterized protein LOC132726029 [Ruditapes philippinarum]
MEEDLQTILHRQQLFCSALKSYFCTKITKYQNILLKNGIQLSDQSGDEDTFHSLPRSQSFEDHIELVIGQKSASPNVYKTFWKIGNRLSTLKLFRWIYLIVQRTKAARVLHHLDGVSDDEIKAVINTVGQEIAVAYEYQLCLLDGDSEIIKLAQHAGACLVTYLNSKEAHYAPENLLQAVVEVKPKSSNNKEILKTRAIFINNHPVCLRWRLSQVFKQPGLRTSSDKLDTDVSNESSTAVKTDEQVVYKGENADCNLSNASDAHLPAGAALTTDAEQSKVESATADDGKSGSDTSDGDKRVTDFNTNAEKLSLCVEPTTNKTKIRRRLNEVDMDFEKGEMTITECSVDASDFSSVGNKALDVEDGDSTSIEEDLNSEKVDNLIDFFTEETCVKEADVSIQGKDKHIREEHSVNFNCILDEKTSHKDPTNDEVNSVRFKECNENVINRYLCNENKHNADINISSESQASPHVDIHDTNSILSAPHRVDVQKDIFIGQTSDSKRNVQDPCDVNPLNDDEHINSDDQIEVHTYQSDTIGSNVSDEYMPDIAAGDKSYVFYGCFTPYGAKCRPKIYGYRGPLHIWNEEQRRYSLIYNDTVTLSRKRQQDSIKPQLSFHQKYIPKTVCKH